VRGQVRGQPGPETARAGMDWLAGELAAVRGELARVDAKCGVLTAVATGAAAFTATQAGHGPLAARVILAAAGVTFAAAVLVLLRVLRPRFGNAGWCRYRQVPAAHLAGLGASGQAPPGQRPGNPRDLMAEDLVVLAGLAMGKYRRVKLAVDLTSAGVILLAAGVVAAVFA